MTVPTADNPAVLYCGDALSFLSALPDDSVDLLMTSPPYELARTYQLKTMVAGQDWVDWMVKIIRAASPKVKGLIAINCEGQTRNHRNSCTPFLLIADLHRAGFNLRKPAIFRRVGIPGSGGPDWLRNDYEPIICVTRPGALPWSDNTACGHAPKWAPGGEMSHRLTDGQRTNQWGKYGGQAGSGNRRADGTIDDNHRPSHRQVTKGRRVARGYADGDTAQEDAYDPPAIANPGNVIQNLYTADEVAKLLGEPTDVVTCKVGGGLMGSPIAHENEAPMPLTLAEFFVRSFCPADGIVIDPFNGSGTTGHAALKWGRRYIGCDIRDSEIEKTTRRLATVQRELFV